MRAPDDDIPSISADTLTRIRDARLRVHCVTNTVAQAYTANMLLAAGAIPSMTTSPQEIGDMASSADALLINLGTLDAERREAIGVALAAAPRAPWVLDPVFADRVAARRDFARALIGRRPNVIRCNAAEFSALANEAAAAAAAMRFAKATGSVIGLTGDVDHVADANRRAAIANGHPYMGLVTAMGCAGSALIAAALAVEPDPWRATVSALVILGVAGELAAEKAAGPGSFAFAIIDALHALDRASLIAKARVDIAAHDRGAD